MATQKFLIYFLIMLITTSPASAAGVSLNKWVLNVTLHDDGVVEEIIQAEFENAGSSPLDGFSFVVPASAIAIDFNKTTGVRVDDAGAMHFVGQDVKQQIISDGVKISLIFNTPIEVKEKWNGRISLTAENWAVKEGMNYSIDIPVKAPKAIVGGNEIEMILPLEPEIRSQVFLPKSVEVTSVLQTPQQKPYKKLLQNNRIVITWFTGNLHVGDVIKIEGSFSDALNKITGTNERLDTVSTRIEEAKKTGMDVLESEAHLKNAADYLNQAEISFWKKEHEVSLQYVGYANDELKLAESSLSAPKTTGVQETAGKPASGIGTAGFVLILLISFLAIKKKRFQ